MKQDQTSLNKYISSSGFCSRREADKLIEQARVTVNGELVLPGAKVVPGDVVEIDGEPIKKASKKERPIYIAFNKPVGVTSTTDPKDRSNIIYFINHPKRIFPVGRLDKDSDGLIFLTNDGDIVNKILRASNNHEKEYVVTVDKAVTPDFITKMSNGVPVLGKVTKKCFVRQEGSRRFRIMLTQGLNRQIRRMCDFLGYKVVELTRVRIMNVELGNLPVGKWRYLTLPEVEQMETMVASSSKTDTGAKPGNKAGAADGRERQYIPKKKTSRQPVEDMDYSELPPRKPAIREGSYKQFVANKKSNKPGSGNTRPAKKQAPPKKAAPKRSTASKNINPKSRKRN